MNPKTKLGILVTISFAALFGGVMLAKQLRGVLPQPPEVALAAPTESANGATPGAEPATAPTRTDPSQDTSPTAPVPPFDLAAMPPGERVTGHAETKANLPTMPVEAPGRLPGKPLSISRNDPNADDDFHAPSLPVPSAPPTVKDGPPDLVPPPSVSLPKRSDGNTSVAPPPPLDLPPAGELRPASHTPTTDPPSLPPKLELPPPDAPAKAKEKAPPPEDLVPLPPVAAPPATNSPPLEAPKGDAPVLQPLPSLPMPINEKKTAPALPIPEEAPKLEEPPTPVPTRPEKKPDGLPIVESQPAPSGPPALGVPPPSQELPSQGKSSSPPPSDVPAPPLTLPGKPQPTDMPVPQAPRIDLPAASPMGPSGLDPPPLKRDKTFDLPPVEPRRDPPSLPPSNDWKTGNIALGPMPQSEAGPKPPSIPPVPVPSETGPKPPSEPPATLGPRPAPADPLETRVDSYDEDWYYCKPGDTLESISQKFYYTPKYEQALRQYNLDRNYKLIFRQEKPNLPPGEVVKVPPARILERTYPTLIPGYRGRSTDAVATQPAATTQVNGTSNLEGIGSPRIYTVRREGMTLRDIAREELRDENQWTRIFNLNRQWNPSAPLPVGTNVYLPGSP
jgi:hypothetical protein